LPERIAGLGGKIIGTVHDEIILEVHEDHSEQAAEIMKEVMIKAGSALLKKVPVDVEVKVTDNWAGK
jgi:DNA polymerase I